MICQTVLYFVGSRLPTAVNYVFMTPARDRGPLTMWMLRPRCHALRPKLKTAMALFATVRNCSQRGVLHVIGPHASIDGGFFGVLETSAVFDTRPVR